MAIKLIGNEPKEKKDLVEIARNNSIIKKALGVYTTRKKISKDDERLDEKINYIDKAQKLVRSVEDFIDYNLQPVIVNGKPIFHKIINAGKHIEGMYESDDNAILAAVKSLSGYTEEAKMLLQLTQDYFGVDSGTNLYYFRNSEKRTDIFNNAAVIIANLLTGNEEQAHRIYPEILNLDFDIKNNLYSSYNYKQEFGRSVFFTSENALMGIAESLINNASYRAEIKDQAIEKYIGRDKDGLFYNCKKNKTEGALVLSEDSAIMVALKYIAGKENEAKELMELIEYKAGLDKDTGLLKIAKDNKNLVSKPSLYMAFAYMILSKDIGELIK
jgi:hypothetical protein